MKKNLLPDTVIKTFFCDCEIFADLFNVFLFHNKKRINPKELTEVNPDPFTIYHRQSKITFPRISSNRKVSMLSKNGIFHLFTVGRKPDSPFSVLLECLLADGLNYLCRDLAVEIPPLPCYNLVLYYGEETWDHPRILSEMLMLSPQETAVNAGFNDYQINLLCLNEIDPVRFNHPELKQFLMLISLIYGREKADLSPEMQHLLTHVSGKTAHAALTITNTEPAFQQWLQPLPPQINMGRVFHEKLEQVRWEGIAEGLERGVKKGKKEGRETALAKAARHAMEKTNCLELAAEILGLETGEVERLLRKSNQ